MHLLKLMTPPTFSEIIDLINVIWPEEWGEKSDSEKIESMNLSFNAETDTTKYLYLKDDIIGFYRYSLWPRNNTNTDTAHTFDIAILPDFQKKGLGKMLMYDMAEDCKKKGLKTLMSRCFKSNGPSRKLHESCGFTLFDQTEDSIVWKLDLS